MELGVVVEPVLGKLDEVADMDRSIVAGQLNANDTLGRGDDCHLFAVGLVLGSVKSHEGASSSCL